MIRIVALLAWLFAAFAGSGVVRAADVRAWLDRDAIELGETVTLNVESKGGGTSQPDFSALKQDFDLLGTQSSQQLSIVNGQRTSSTLWAVGLQPRHAGRLTIAPIAVGDAQTAPVELEVRAATAATQPRAGDDVFLEVAAEPLDPYVQQQVRYTVKLYYAFDLTNGNLAEPAADGLAVQRLGQDKTYFATLGGRRYHVVERHYALTPERSGEVTVSALAFRGSALDSADPTGFFSRGRSVAARSQEVRLDVRAKPAEWTEGAWLPAASMLLKDEAELPDEVRVGDPLTRTIRLQAQGLGYEQLPEFDLAAPAGADVYPDKADTRTRDDGEWLYGERVRKFAFVPQHAGSVTVPGLSVRWWDTVHDRMQTSELPAREIKVLPALGHASSAPGAGVAPAVAARVEGSAVPAAEAIHALGWRSLALAGFCLWLLTLAAWGWHARGRRHERVRQQTSPSAAPAGAAAQRASFLRACALGDLAGCERALVAWARTERPHLHNPGALAAELDDASQRDAIAALQRVRYAGAPAQGIASQLGNAFRAGFSWRAAAPKRVAGALPELYPHR
jgi:hypothetical protein